MCASCVTVAVVAADETTAAVVAADEIQAPATPSKVDASATSGLEGLLAIERASGPSFFRAAPDLATGLAVNGALAFGADRALQQHSADPNAGLAIGTASIFTIAPIVRTHYGWAVGASAYALAVATGTYAYRHEEGSGKSVLLGSALGLAVGETVAFHSSRMRELQNHFVVHGKSLGLKMKF
jgi:hypothetical protein